MPLVIHADNVSRPMTLLSCLAAAMLCTLTATQLVLSGFNTAPVSDLTLHSSDPCGMSVAKSALASSSPSLQPCLCAAGMAAVSYRGVGVFWLTPTDSTLLSCKRASLQNGGFCWLQRHSFHRQVNKLPRGQLLLLYLCAADQPANTR